MKLKIKEWIDKNGGILLVITVAAIFFAVFAFFGGGESNDELVENSMIIQDEQQIKEVNKDHQEFRDYIKNNFEDMTVDKQVDYVDKLYFSSCYEVETICSDEQYADLEGCVYCNRDKGEEQ